MNASGWGLPRGLFQELRLWLVPIGVGIDWWGPESTIPSNFRAAYGQSYLISDVPRLAKAWGITSGLVTMPDKRGRVSIGKDDMGGSAANRVTTGGSGINGATLGAAGGAETVALVAANNGAHRHRLFGLGAGTGTTGGPVAVATAWANIASQHAPTTGAYADTDTSGNPLAENQGSGTAHQNMPPGIVCNYIIKVG